MASVLSYSQERDSIKSKLSNKSIGATAPPLLGGITVGVLVSPINSDDDDFVLNQNTLEMRTPLYGNTNGKHPYIGKMTLKYNGLYLSENEIFGKSNFHSLQALHTHTLILPRRRTLTFLTSVGAGSDFKEGFTGEDITFNAGLRMGWLRNRSFVFGVSIIYVNNYVGQFLLPIPDFAWKINENWSLEAILPQRISLKHNFSQFSSLGLNIEMNSGNYQIHDEEEQDQFLNFFQFNGGLNYEKVFAKRWKFNAFVGYTLTQRLQAIDNDKKAGLNDFKSLQDDDRADISLEEKSPIFQFSFSYSF